MVLPAASPRLTVQYGAFTLDAANQIAIQAKNRRYQLWETHEAGFFSCEFVLRLAAPSGNDATDDAAFRTLINATELALSKRRMKLTVALGGGVINGNGAGWDPAKAVGTPTAYNVVARVFKTGGNDHARRRTYLFVVECGLPAETAFNFRRDSSAQTITGVNGRRICSVRGKWTASANASALDNYNANADTYFGTLLPTPVTNGQWVQVSADPLHDDADGLTVGGNEVEVTRLYWEVVLGLREYKVDVTVGANQAKIVTISGLYMGTPDGQSALQNYNANFQTFDNNVLDGEGGHAKYEAKSTPGVAGYDTTGKLYRFVHTYKWINYQQGPGSTDDQNITDYSLEVAQVRNYTRQTQSKSNTVTRLQRAVAIYKGIIDINSAGGTDPYQLYTNKFRGYILNAVQTKLGSLSVIIESERPAVSLDGNMLTVQMSLLIRGGSILSLSMREELTDTPALDPDPILDGDDYTYWPYGECAEKFLARIAVVEYVSGSPKPKIWGPSEEGSGFRFTDTGKSMEEVLAALKQKVLPATPGWCPKWPDALKEASFPGSSGENEGLATNVYTRIESWFYVAKWGQPKTATGQGGDAGGATPRTISP